MAFTDLEEKILELEGVFSCIITGEENIEEIHIVASKNRPPKRIVRDIETMVMVNSNTEINHKKISIAQVSNASEAVVEDRVEIISIFRENNKPVIHFRININDSLVEEEIDTIDVIYEEVLPETVARGLIDIIQKYTSFQGKIRLEQCFTTGINNEIVIAQLLVYGKGKGDKERLVGAAYVNNELPLATGKACLKALNRRLNHYI